MKRLKPLSLSVAVVVACSAAAAEEFGDTVAGEKIYKQCKTQLSCKDLGSPN